MPKLIAHRGNLHGSDKGRENSPSYIIEAVNAGFDVEVDVWYTDDKLYLGHDTPDYKVDLEFLKMSQLWCHAKSVKTLNFLLENGINCFFHSTDDATLTSRGLIWLFPGIRPVSHNSIIVMPEQANYDKHELLSSYAICTDKVDHYENILNLK